MTDLTVPKGLDHLAIKSPLVGPKILLEGPSGTGKTTAIKTLAAAGIKPFVLTMEPGYEVLGDTPVESLGWHFIQQTASDWQSMIDTGVRVNSLSYETIWKSTDPNRGKYRRFIQVLETLSNFKDDRTGKVLGPVDVWGTGRAIVLDHLTELSSAAAELTVGGKPVMQMPEYQMAMNTVEFLIRKLCISTRCWFILIAHIEREVDEVLGGSKITAATLGRKLAPKLPPLFSDVILSSREGKKFLWSTAYAGADLKTRNLEFEENLPQDFAAIVRKWKSRGGIVEPE